MSQNLQNILEKTKMKVWTKAEIHQQHNNMTSYLLIDNIIVVNNRCWCFYLEKSHAGEKLNEFIKNTYEIATMNNTACIGIYITKKKINSTMQYMIQSENSKGTGCGFYMINETTETMIFKKIHQLLHENTIYMYDDDNDVIMGNT